MLILMRASSLLGLLLFWSCQCAGAVAKTYSICAA